MFEIRVAVCQENAGPICVLPIICKQTRRHLYFQSIPADMMRVCHGGRGNNGEWLKGGPGPFYRNLTNTEYISNALSLLNWAVSNIYWFDQRRKKSLKIFKIGLVGMNSLYWHWCFPTKLDFSVSLFFPRYLWKEHYKKNIFSQFHFFFNNFKPFFFGNSNVILLSLLRHLFVHT